MFDKLQAIEKRYDKLMVLISDPAVQADQQEYRIHTKALSEIQPLIEQFRAYKAAVEEMAQAKELAEGPEEDEELRELAEQELTELEARRDALLNEIKVLLVPKDPNDEKNVVKFVRVPGVMKPDSSLPIYFGCTHATRNHAGGVSRCFPRTRPVLVPLRKWSR